MKLLFFDTEITGTIKKGAPIEEQPHIVQLAMVVTDKDLTPRFTYCSFVQLPEDDESGPMLMPEAATRINGITDEMLWDGSSPQSAAEIFTTEFSYADKIICHDADFDISIMDIFLRRHVYDYDNAIDDAQENGRIFCTMKASTDILKLPNPKFGGEYRWPKLGEAYEFFTGNKLEGAHNALVDVMATIEVYRGILAYSVKC